ncbi:MAG TPA: MBL fold metallo-hydrolase, partial [Pirellulaceae bacterium]
GREALGAHEVPVHVMPRMRQFLTANGPWEQLVALRNMVLNPLEADTPFELNDRLRITPRIVPHRDEYSETVGFLIQGPQRRVLFIPDINKWELWNVPLEEALAEVDVAYLDATFFDGEELPGRDLSEIPHPFVVETMRRLAELPASERSKVRFIHLNHTNPALRGDSAATRQIREAGFQIAVEGETIYLG